MGLSTCVPPLIWARKTGALLSTQKREHVSLLLVCIVFMDAHAYLWSEHVVCIWTCALWV
jgi:hypothetical protein